MDDDSFPGVSTQEKRKAGGSRSGKRRCRNRMASGVDSQYKDLLNPIKDPEKSFAVDISELLQSYIAGFLDSQSTPNFNSAALLIQGSASVYGKKVEYLYNLALQLHNNLSKQRKDDPQQVRKETKEKEKKVEKLNDPFISVDFKIGKNLSCLKKKNASKPTVQKSTKGYGAPSITVHLLSNDIEDKGEVFYDTSGEVVGNKGDFAINKCHLISSGWLLLPTVNPKLVPPLTAVPDYYDDLDLNEPCDINLDDIDAEDLVENNIPISPDEGLGSSPLSGEAPVSTPDVNSENNPETPMETCSIVPPSTDDGIADTADDAGSQTSGTSEGNENIPAANGRHNKSLRPRLRQSLRTPLKPVQLPSEDDPLAGLTIDGDLLVRKKIQKKCVCAMPKALKKKKQCEPEVIPPISLYCARTFFAIEDKGLKKSLLHFDSIGFQQNVDFVDRIVKRLSALKAADKNKLVDPFEDEQEINVEEIECLQEANDSDEDTLCAPFDDQDIQVDHENSSLFPRRSVAPEIHTEPNGDIDPDLPAADPDLPSPNVSQFAKEEYERHIEELGQFSQNSELTKRIHDWQNSVKPFLDLMDQRESFDINLYGHQILDSFEDNNRKQTKTFREICKDKEKWEIHRSFMALLPLANMSNVALETEEKEDGTEDIFVTLLSRRMHHIELEDFGHNDGSHS